MEEVTLKSCLEKLAHQINNVRVLESLEPSEKKLTTAQGGTDGVQELFDSIQFKLKYLLFDLEATYRENMVLRKMLKGLDD